MTALGGRTMFLTLAALAAALLVPTAPAAALQAAPAAKPAAVKAAVKAKTTKKKAAARATAPAAEEAQAKPPAGSSPLEELKQANTRLKKAVAKAGPSWSPEGEAKNAEVKKVVGELLDFEELGRRALAKHWDGLTPKQRTEFIATLRSLVERSYVKSVHGQPEYDLKFDKEEVTGGEATVPATLMASRKGKKVPISLVYRMIYKGRRWVVYDVVTDDVSLLENYRSEFGKVISKEGFDGLVARMKKKLDDKSGG